MNLGEFDYQKSMALLEQAATEEDLAFYYWLYISIQELVLRVTQPTVRLTYGWLRGKGGNHTQRVAGRFRSGRGAEATAGDASDDATA